MKLYRQINEMKVAMTQLFLAENLKKTLKTNDLLKVGDVFHFLFVF